MGVRRTSWLAGLLLVLAGCVAADRPSGELSEVLVSPRDHDTSPVTSTSSSVPTTAASEIANDGRPSRSSELVLLGESGDGWQLIHVDGPAALPFLPRFDFLEWSYGQAHLLSPGIATSSWALDRMWEHVSAPLPVLDFETQTLLRLPVAVPGQCAEARFDGLVIADTSVYGLIDHEPAFAMLDYYLPRARVPPCTVETWQMTFYIVVDAELLPPPGFTLHAENPYGCLHCRGPYISVDLTDTSDLDTELFGPPGFRILYRGARPPSGRLYMLLDLERRAGYLISRGEWPRASADTGFTEFGGRYSFEAFVVECEGADVPNTDREHCLECDGSNCDAYQPLGEICRFEYEPIPQTDQTVILTFDGTNCTLEVETTTG